MFPYINIFGRLIGLYPLMALCGIFSMGIYTCYISRKTGYDDNDTILFLLLVFIGVFIGSHLLYGLVNYKEILYVINHKEELNSVENIYNEVKYIFGGSIFYGGLLGGLLVGCIYMRIGHDKAYLLDIVSPSIPLFHFWGRIGCFLGGCCYGRESVFGFTFRHAIIESANNVKRFPVQIMEAVFNLSLFVVLDLFRRRKLFKNHLLYIYLVIYSAGRFFIEFVRGDDFRGKLLFLSTSQVISVFLFCFGLYHLYKYSKILYHPYSRMP